MDRDELKNLVTAQIDAFAQEAKEAVARIHENENLTPYEAQVVEAALDQAKANILDLPGAGVN